jgi:hypothetical protein
MNGITSLQLIDDNAGRWGNQLFRIATMIGYAKEHNLEYFIPEEWKYRVYLENAHQYKDVNGIINNIQQIYNEPGFHYNTIPAINNGIIEIRGYYQSNKYFNHAEQEVQSFLTINSDILNSVTNTWFKESKTRLCIHIRHGDFFDRARNGGHKGNEHYHPVMSLQYYKNAIELILSKVLIDEFMIFTDHPETKDFIFNKFDEYDVDIVYMDFNEEFIYDFAAQSLCDHAIIPNSTFSWWSAYLNKNPNKIICCPNPSDWFGPGYNHFIKDDLLPDTWHKINQ